VNRTTGNFGDEGCPSEGSGNSDHDLNRLKNRDLPPESYEAMTIKTILENQPAEAVQMRKKHRKDWDPGALDEVRQWEDKGVSVQGHIAAFKREGLEGCNCKSQDHRDYHVWLVPGVSGDRASGMVVEISPRLLDQHPGWTEDALQNLIDTQGMVRISGWLTWDEEHPEQVGRTRGTLWEIHPIHKIEFLDENHRWKSLDEQ
jgi:hypothetical protein